MKSCIAWLGVALLCAFGADAQPRRVEVARTEQAIGSWLISCAMDPMTDTRVCRMRNRTWVVVPDSDHPGMALEVLARSDQLVPALTVRNLSLSSALSGLLALTTTAQIRFDGAPMAELPCTLDRASVICAPSNLDAATLATQLVAARSVLVQFRTVGNLPLPVPDGPLALDLAGTREALAAFRAAGPAAAPAQPSLADELRDSAQRLLDWLGGDRTSPPAR
jgi:hypothetical protein